MTEVPLDFGVHFPLAVAGMCIVLMVFVTNACWTFRELKNAKTEALEQWKLTQKYEELSDMEEEDLL